MGILIPTRRTMLVSLAIALVTVGILLAMDRPPICECGYVKLWHGKINDAGNSQHIADWYTPSHIIHGMLFYALGWLLFAKWGWASPRWGLPLAVFIEAAWEIVENTPFVINRFRDVTANFGYSGDSVLNSAADIGWMSCGFYLALRLPVWLTVTLAVAAELIVGLIVRDNLTLNVIMLLFPIEAIADWQAAGTHG